MKSINYNKYKLDIGPNEIYKVMNRIFKKKVKGPRK